ncbi:hypothetical protein AB6A40_003153 [Gnathostoma spinigerum]|uniref:UDP-N-acetylglucosamine diphosphorylase n=1 Tax=Gnathostoma spinigerum TaxID=75299 RepID=A0ABD6EGH9_9BILA
MGSLLSSLSHNDTDDGRSQLESYVGIKQQHLLKYWDELNSEEKKDFAKQLRSIDICEAENFFEKSAIPKKLGKLEPIDLDHTAIRKNIPEEKLTEYFNIALDAIAENKVAAVVLAGGQASRLGAKEPKGTLGLGIEEYEAYNSLLGIQAGRIVRLQNLAQTKHSNKEFRIQWLIMTSEATYAATRRFIEANVDMWKMNRDQITIFNQAQLPCFDFDGKIILADKGRMATAPNGNGGLYDALLPYLNILREKGVRYFHVYCVDNILCRVVDPHFMGFCIANDADCAAKVVEKTDPAEEVGVVCRDEGITKVVEYSEIPAETASARDEDGRLIFRAGNIANHYFTIDFLDKVCGDITAQLPYHRACKKIPYVSDDGVIIKPEEANGIKLERFVFDIFMHSTNFFIWEVKREEEFSPLKNADSAEKDCRSSCVRDLYSEHRRWLTEKGAQIEGDGRVLIHPLRSYCGEDLDDFKDTDVVTPYFIDQRL